MFLYKQYFWVYYNTLKELLVDQVKTSRLCNCLYTDRSSVLTDHLLRLGCSDDTPQNSSIQWLSGFSQLLCGLENELKPPNKTDGTFQHVQHFSVCFCEEWQTLAVKHLTLNYSAHVKSWCRMQAALSRKWTAQESKASENQAKSRELQLACHVWKSSYKQL